MTCQDLRGSRIRLGFAFFALAFNSLVGLGCGTSGNSGNGTCSSGSCGVGGTCSSDSCGLGGTCSSGSCGAGGSARSLFFTGGSNSNASDTDTPRTCQSSASSPVFSVTGQACGHAVEYRTPTGYKIVLGRRSMTEDPETITTVAVKDSHLDTLMTMAEYIQGYDFYFSLSINGGFGLKTGSSSVTVDVGSIWACGIGTMALSSGTTLTIDVQSIDEGGSGTMKATIKGLVAGGFARGAGTTSVPTCSGEGSLTVVLDGPFEHIPG